MKCIFFSFRFFPRSLNRTWMKGNKRRIHYLWITRIWSHARWWWDGDGIRLNEHDLVCQRLFSLLKFCFISSLLFSVKVNFARALVQFFSFFFMGQSAWQKQNNNNNNRMNQRIHVMGARFCVQWTGNTTMATWTKRRKKNENKVSRETETQ